MVSVGGGEAVVALQEHGAVGSGDLAVFGAARIVKLCLGAIGRLG